MRRPSAMGIFSMIMLILAGAAFVLMVWGIIQALEAYLILPMIMKGAVNVHPAITLFTVVLWGKIFGVAGLMLAIPINLTIWTLLDHLRMREMEGPEEPRSAPDTEARAEAKTG